MLSSHLTVPAQPWTLVLLGMFRAIVSCRKKKTPGRGKTFFEV